MTSTLLRILVVDDEALIRWSVSELLRLHGHTVLEAASASDARAAIDATPAFDVVLLDDRLPDSADLKLLEEIRRRMPESAVVLMTGYGGPDLVQGALERGAYCVIDKPFDIQDLDSMVRNAHRATRLH